MFLQLVLYGELLCAGVKIKLFKKVPYCTVMSTFVAVTYTTFFLNKLFNSLILSRFFFTSLKICHIFLYSNGHIMAMKLH